RIVVHNAQRIPNLQRIDDKLLVNVPCPFSHCISHSLTYFQILLSTLSLLSSTKNPTTCTLSSLFNKPNSPKSISSLLPTSRVHSFAHSLRLPGTEKQSSNTSTMPRTSSMQRCSAISISASCTSLASP